MIRDPKILMEACHAAISNPLFKPENGVTHCNEAVSFVANTMGYKGFDKMVANEMINLMEKSEQWSILGFKQAQEKANEGNLVIAGQKGNLHGHVCVVIPGDLVYSKKWAASVPVVSNVGKDVFIGKGLNWAFATEPTIWGINLI